MVGEAASALVELTPLSQSAVGTVFAAIANSLPELVTAIAAVRIGAVDLAVGDVIGGNSFEVLFLAAADFFYRPGSIYHEFDTDNVLIAVLAILMTRGAGRLAHRGGRPSAREPSAGSASATRRPLRF